MEDLWKSINPSTLVYCISAGQSIKKLQAHLKTNLTIPHSVDKFIDLILINESPNCLDDQYDFKTFVDQFINVFMGLIGVANLNITDEQLYQYFNKVQRDVTLPTIEAGTFHEWQVYQNEPFKVEDVAKLFALKFKDYLMDIEEYI
ncbi:hypothetical protein O9G_002308 [Rozella allomycis CSF55]|uniref:Uncharacterized protein n=1 Tax=Rozella allomycis (strain CSF55) TaxID=988480 RepID=A0A075AQK5_ROZAC|nr:hypothetical protein O9G_002308 [Rozella allomycis CSF55]|eukprot:EPZ32531.1 hypothetical protein O9G_002308 [Rozella allomycis CSF55]